MTIDLAFDFQTKVVTTTGISTIELGQIVGGGSFSCTQLAACPTIIDLEAKKHTHANKSVLDQIEEAFTTALKNTYDSAVSAISSLISALNSHVSNTTNPHNVTANQVGALPTPTGTPDGTKFLRDDNSWQVVSAGRTPKFSIYYKNFETLTGSPFPFTGANFVNNIIEIPSNTLVNGDNFNLKIYIDKLVTTSGTCIIGASIGNSPTLNDRQNALAASSILIYGTPSAQFQFWVTRFNITTKIGTFAGISGNLVSDILTTSNLTTSLVLDFTQPIYIIPYVYNGNSTITLNQVEFEIW